MNPFIGEIRMFGGTFAPSGWAFCAGQLLPISQNEALYTLIGTTYGGDGQNTFQLPDLRGRVPVHQGQSTGQNYVIGSLGGAEQVTLTTQQLPSHPHSANGSTSTSANATSPSANAWSGNDYKQFSTNAPNAQMNAGSMGLTGGGQPHDNMLPYLGITFIIALVGIFPSQN